MRGIASVSSHANILCLCFINFKRISNNFLVKNEIMIYDVRRIEDSLTENVFDLV